MQKKVEATIAEFMFLWGGDDNTLAYFGKNSIHKLKNFISKPYREIYSIFHGFFH